MTIESNINNNKNEKIILKIGVIGAGCIAKNHLMSLLLIENNRKIWGKYKRVKIKAICDIDKTKLEAIKNDFPGLKYYDNPDDLINDTEIDVVYVLTPTKFHKELTIKAVNNGKHVFVEKPLAMNLAEIDEMIKARDQSGKNIQVGLVFRSAAIIEYLKKYFEDNKEKLGKPLSIAFRDSQWKPYTGEDSHASFWRKDKQMAHAGILFEHTIHDIDAMTYIFGEPVEVYGKVRYIAGFEGIEDNVAAVIQFKDGPIMNITANWHNIHHDQRRVEIYFENAYFWFTVDDKNVVAKMKYLDEDEIDIDLAEADKYFREELLKMPHLKEEITGPYYYENVRFIDSIFNNYPSYPGLEIARNAQEIIEWIYESSKKDEPIKLN